MARIKKATNFRRVAASPLTLLFLVGAVVLGGRGVWRLYQRNLIPTRERAAATAELARLEAREQELKTAVASLETTEGKKAVLRENFPVAAPGERVIHLLDDKAPTGTASGSVLDEAPWWRRWWAGLFE